MLGHAEELVEDLSLPSRGPMTTQKPQESQGRLCPRVACPGAPGALLDGASPGGPARPPGPHPWTHALNRALAPPNLQATCRGHPAPSTPPEGSTGCREVQRYK